MSWRKTASHANTLTPIWHNLLSPRCSGHNTKESLPLSLILPSTTSWPTPVFPRNNLFLDESTARRGKSCLFNGLLDYTTQHPVQKGKKKNTGQEERKEREVRRRGREESVWQRRGGDGVTGREWKGKKKERRWCWKGFRSSSSMNHYQINCETA